MNARQLPIVDATAASAIELAPGTDHGEACITCGDVALVLTVVEVDEADARCRDEHGAEEVVAVDLIEPVAPGDRVLVHARVALERLPPAEG